MKTPVQFPTTQSSLLSAFRSYLITLGLSSISCKLYSADVSRLLSSTGLTNLTLSTLANPDFYTNYLTKPEFEGSATLLRRTLASLRRFGLFLSLHYDIQNPTNNLSLTVNTPDLALSTTSQKYIKACIEYLKDNHLSEASLRSYKSDITQYLTYLESHHPSTHISSLLNEKNLEIYTDLLTHLQTQSPSTIERKTKTIRRFINWYNRFKLKVIVSDNNKIAAHTSTTNLLSASVSPNSTYPASGDRTEDSHQNSSPDVAPYFVKKSNYRKFRLPTPKSLLSFAILLLFVSTLSIFTYRQFGSSANLTAAFPNTPITPNRQLSFQGRLENASGTPITSGTNFVFKLFDASSGGTELYSSGTCSITPDTDGVFSTQIGGTCGSGIGSNVFTENADVWLEVTVAAETLTPRQQIATVAYALNSETIQGFPISATVSAIRNTVVPMNQWGEIIVGEQSPRLTGVAGTFQISAPSLSLITAAGTNGNITLAPDGTGQVNLNGNTTTTNFFNVSNAQLTTGSLITGTVANDNTGFNLLNLFSGSTPTSKFSVSDAGNTTIAGTLNLPNSNTLTGVANYTQFSQGISVGGNTTYYINSSGNANFNNLTLSGTLDANGQLDLGDGGDTVTINGSSVTLTGFNCTGNTNGGTLTTNGSGVLQCSDDDGGAGDGSSNWQSNLGSLSPINSTWDVLVGGTATSSAKAGFININSGTPTATVSAGTAGGAYLTADGNLATTANQSLILGGSTTGNITLNENSNIAGHAAIGATASVDGDSPGWGQTFSTLLTTHDTITSLSTDYTTGIFTNLTLNPAATLTNSIIGTMTNIQTAAGNTETINDINGNDLFISNEGDGTITSINGSQIEIGNYGAGTIGGAVGQYINLNSITESTAIQTNISKNDTTASNTYGINSAIFNSAATSTGTDLTYGRYNYVNRQNATGGTQNTYGDYIQLETDNSGAGTHTAYGVYLNLDGNADTNYPIYIQNSGLNNMTAGIRTAGAYSYGVDLSGSSIDNAEIRLSNNALIDNSTDGFLSFTEPQITLNASTKVNINAPTIDLSNQNTSVTLNSAVNALSFDTNTLSIDALNNQVGIGDTSPDHKLDVDGNIGLTAGGYINWGDTDGTSGYGLRDNAGTLQFKNSAGSWTDIGSGSGGWTDAGTYLYPTGGEVLGNSASGGANKLAGIYLADSSPLTFGTDNDFSFAFNNATSTLGSTLTSGTRLGINTTSALATLDVRSNLGTIPTASISGNTSMATIIVDQSGSGDIFTASSAGQTRFVVKNNGNVGIDVADPTNKLEIGGSTSTISNDAGDITLDSASNNISFAGDSLINILNTYISGELGVGVADAIGRFHVHGATTGKALAILNELGDQDILTASASGITRFRLTNTGSLSLNGDYINFALTDGTSGYGFRDNGGTLQFKHDGGSWADVGSGGASWWDQTLGTLQPYNKTVDLLLGGTSTESAKIALININSGTPTATISAGTSGGIYIDASGKIATTAKQTLALGDATTTGNIILQGGNVGIGVASPTQKLEVNGYIVGQRFEDSASSSYYIDPAATGTSVSIDGNIVGNGAFYLSTGNDAIAVSIGTTGAGKLDAGTIDPPYTINGEKFATYMTSMTGVKEETTGTVATNEYISGKGYRATLDFAGSLTGSDLWLFSKTTSLQSQLDKLVVLTTAAGNSKTWYELDAELGKLYLFATNPTLISYRLTAPRFDANNWQNTRDSDSIGFVIDSPNTWSVSEEIASLYSSISETIQETITNTLSTSLISPLASNSAIVITTSPSSVPSSLPSGNDYLNNDPLLVVDGTLDAATISARTAYLNDVVAETITARDIVADTITANTIIGLDAKIASLSGITDSDIDSITDRIKDRLNSLTDPATAQDLPTPTEATTSAESNSELDIFTLDASGSATLSSADIDFATINQYLAVIGNATITTLDVTNGIYTNDLGSKNGLLALQPLGGIVNIASNTMIVDSLTGTVSINGNLVVSGTVLADKASLNQLEIGTPSDASSSALGKLLSVYNESGRAVATIDASGSANLASLTTNMITIASAGSASDSSALSNLIGSAQSNATAGVATLTSPNTELTISSPYVTSNSLVYLTPTTNTDNKVLFVQSKITCPETALALDPNCSPSFTVGIDSPASSDISFNWWIIELSPTQPVNNGESEQTI